MIKIRLHYGEDRIKLEGFIEQKIIFNITKLSNLAQICHSVNSPGRLWSMACLHFCENHSKLEGFKEQKNMFDITKLSNLAQILQQSK
jgi:hypothetical protein